MTSQFLMLMVQDQPLVNHSGSFEGVRTDVFFRNLDQALIRCIRESDVVVGSVAWLTHPGILDALAAVTSAHIVVQKEDFLRPDSGGGTWKADLHARYDRVPSAISRYNSSLPIPLRNMSYLGDPTLQAIRCVGNHNTARAAASPRAHNKFVVFCRITEPAHVEKSEFLGELQEHQVEAQFEPYAVWTGSFNFSHNATLSFENAVVMYHPELAQAYFSEWAQIMALSEPLDWSSVWVEPEFRIGS